MSMDSIRLKARVLGLFWLGTIITSVLGEFLIRPAFVMRDPARTAAGVAAAGSLANIAVASNLVTNLCYVGVTILLYELMRPVSRAVARFGLAVGLLGLSLGLVSVIAQVGQLALLRARWVDVSKEQLELLSYMGLALATWIFSTAMSLFGLQIATTGWLITRSTFFPRWIGALLLVGGSLYFVGSITIIIAPFLQTRILPVMIASALLGEGAFTGWLIFKGVDAPRWLSMTTAGVHS